MRPPRKRYDKLQLATEEIRALLVEPNVVREAIDADSASSEFYMVNLSKHRAEALYPDGSSRGLTGEEADSLYTDRAINEFLPSIGAYPVIAGKVRAILFGTDGDWENYAVVRYPGRAQFQTMVFNAEFQQALIHKNAGLERNTVMMTVALREARFNDPI